MFTKLKYERTSKKLSWIENFKSKFDITPHGTWPRTNQKCDPTPGWNWNSERGRWNNNCNCRYTRVVMAIVETTSVIMAVKTLTPTTVVT